MSYVVDVLTVIPKLLGFSGTVLAFVSIIGLILFFKLMELVDRVYCKARKHWRRLPVWGRQIVLFLAAIVVWKLLWPVFPKTVGTLSVVLALWFFWWVQGLRHASAYGLTDTSPRKAWEHHWDASRDARKLTRAMQNGSTKKGGRARKPVPTPTGQVFVAEPNDGQSAEELAEEYNSGRLTAATAREKGWDDIKAVNATEMPDGTVLVNIENQVTESKGDPLAETRWWKP